MGLASEVRVRARQLSDVAKPTHRDMGEGLIVVNPPWGERLSTDEAVKKLYAALGRVLHTEFLGGKRLCSQPIPNTLDAQV